MEHAPNLSNLRILSDPAFCYFDCSTQVKTASSLPNLDAFSTILSQTFSSPARAWIPNQKLPAKGLSCIAHKSRSSSPVVLLRGHTIYRSPCCPPIMFDICVHVVLDICLHMCLGDCLCRRPQRAGKQCLALNFSAGRWFKVKIKSVFGFKWVARPNFLKPICS